MMEVKIKPNPPFNFNPMCGIVNNKFDGKEIYENAIDGKNLYLVLNQNNDIIPLMIYSNEIIENPVLYVRFWKKISERNVKQCIKIIEQMFDTNLNLRLFYKFVESDRILNNIVKRLYGLRSPSTPTLFEAFIRAFIEQQMPLMVSNKIANRVIKNFGGSIEIGGVRYYAFPTAEQLVGADEERLRNCGLNRRKVQYIKNFSNLILIGEIDLDKISEWNTDRIIHELIKIKGIGKWTAEYVMIRGMHKYAVTPADDLFLRKVISHYYFSKNKISGDKSREICEKWGEWRGLASFYLIMDYFIRNRE